MKTLICIFSLVPGPLWSQFFFDFETCSTGIAGSIMSGMVEQLPAGRWECMQEDAISGSSSLHHQFDNPESGCDHFLVRIDPVLDTGLFSCTFRLRHGYPPSAANNWQVALLADIEGGGEGSGNPALEEYHINNGLVLGVNFMGSDDMVSLWECREGDCIEICATHLNFQEQVGTDAVPEFGVTRESNGRVEILYSRDPDVSPAEVIGHGLVDRLPVGRNLVIRYEYSSARDRNLWIDDILLEGSFARDTFPPRITGLEVVDGSRLQLRFSEKVAVPPPSTFRLWGASYGSMIPDTVVGNEQGMVLEFARNIPNREELFLEVTGVCDTDANCLSDTVVACIRNDPEWGDVVFNELMVDPVPGVQLPGVEFIEIYNRSAFSMDLSGWRVAVDERNHSIDSLILDPSASGGVTGMILEPSAFGLIYGINLPNDGASLCLFSGKGALVHAATYTLPWNGLDWKKEGGWSLESPDPNLVCNISKMWEFSVDRKGGTPGSLNSIHAELEDGEPPLFLYAGFGEQPGSLTLRYSEPVWINDEEGKQFILMPGGASPILEPTGGAPVESSVLLFGEALQVPGEFILKIPPLMDCAGNRSSGREFHGGATAMIRAGCLLINEIMYDPVEGAPEFVELFHPGNDFFDLRDFALGITSGGSGTFSPVALSEHSRITGPGEYLVVTKSASRLMEAYHLEASGRWVEVEGMSAMGNAGGTIYLTDRAGETVDMAPFGDQMHTELLDVTRGVSLERISAIRPGNISENWHSSASIEGYSTPGRKNSQSAGGVNGTRLLGVDPEVFSPDNDGTRDLLEISIDQGGQGWVINMWITDLAGQPVRILANNHLSGPSSGYTWDGSGDDGAMVSAGFYVVHARGYHPGTGEQWVRRVAVGVVYW